jgi:pimeloyl-ACP methyl ester carboxylesterase
METARTGTLRVPGADLYYELRGSGPLLLLIPPGGGDADSFGPLADHLASRHTVITYDRRGYARSPLDDPGDQQRVETHADDAYHLLAAVSSKPADVFGSSGGALIGLDLAARHPGQVRTLVAHEPPVQYLVPGAERLPAAEDMNEIYQREGAAVALRKFAARIGVTEDHHAARPDPSGDRTARSAANWEFFFSHEIGSKMWSRYTLDVDTLKSVSARVVPAGGQAGRQFVGYRCATALAHTLGNPLVEFPGHHAGFLTHPQTFAETLHQILASPPATTPNRR